MARGLALVLVVLWGCAGEPARPAGASAPPREVRLAVAGRGSRSVTTEVMGTVRAVRSGTVAPVVSGTVAEVRIGLGSAVRAGNVLPALWCGTPSSWSILPRRGSARACR
jgi:multidrug efflux pump subunit AcrA (membrane-fusion protein)